MINVKIIGCGGYGGLGLVELLLRHPEANVRTLVAATETGMPMSRLYPHLRGFCDLPIRSPDDEAAKEPADVVFFSTPDGVGQRGAAAELARGAKVVDFSGDFRFEDAATYAEYARRLGKDPVHKAPELLVETVYGLPELNRARYREGQRLVGNPGCFAMSCLLGLAPAAKYGLVEAGSVICDCKTGISGAGKKPSAGHHFPARYENMGAYRLSGHQHVMEIETLLGRLAGEAWPVTFTAQVVPVCRGILSCLYGTLREGVGSERVREAYEEMYRGERFVRIHGRDEAVGTAHVRGSNFCDLVVDVDERTRRLRIVSHIDNLVKGQAGNAVQNMNRLCGLPEEMGLDHPGMFP